MPDKSPDHPKSPKLPQSAVTRIAAARLLDAVLTQRELLSDALNAPHMARLDPSDKARAQRLATESLRYLSRLDKILAPFLRKAPPPKAMNIMRIGTYELCQGAAAHGVVNDVVTALGNDRKTGHVKPLGNAVMRKVAEAGPKEWGKLPVPSLPKWLRKPLAEAYGNKRIQLIEGAHARGAPVDLTTKGNPKDLAEKLGAKLLPTRSVRLMESVQLSTLPGFEDGEWWVQDAAAALPARLLDAQPGETVLDLCCAPGGKTMQLAATGAAVTAVDLSETRLERVETNLARTGLTATLVQGDVMDVTGQYDKILLDAPCSATGTIRRHPDLPLARDGAEISGLIAVQAKMLAHALDLLKPGGTLVFCTCSLLPDEGECQVDEILAAREDVSVDREALKLPGVEPDWITEEGGLRLRPDYWPKIGGMDGFYMAALRKSAPAAE